MGFGKLGARGGFGSLGVLGTVGTLLRLIFTRAENSQYIVVLAL